ncbi:unnamed protein product [Ectocarpus sp. 13 AM-2016]
MVDSRQERTLEFRSSTLALRVSFMDSLHSTGARARGGAKAASDFEPHVIHPWKPHGWRTLAKLAARPVSKWRGVELGLYSAGSHNVIGIPDCRVHHPSVNLAVKTLQESTKKIGVTGFRQENLDGDLRYVQMAVERTSGQVQLTLVWNEENYRDATPKLQLLAKDLRSSRPELFHSIWVNFRVGVGNAIFSRDPHSWHRCSGPEYLKEVVGPSKIPFFFSPPLFRQGNLDHFESIVQAVVDWVPEGSGVCELYAGVGVLGLNVAAKAAFVRCSDVNSFNPRSFERSRKTLPSNLRKRVSFEAMSADEAMEDGESEGCEVLIVDPPRKGLDKGVMDALMDPEDPNTEALRRVIYVSCGFDALKRDAMNLIGAGWVLRHSEGFVLFPGSDHIETFAIFDR